MGDTENLFAKLQDLSSFLESEGSLDDNLYQLAATAARILNAENCSIMLLNEGEMEDLSLRVCANFGSLPAAAYKEAVQSGEGVSGHVIATGKSLLVEDIAQSGFAQWARRSNDPRTSLISSPITLNGKIVGVINVNTHRNNRAFTLDDLNLLDIVALFIGKSIQVIQLQNILRSRFVQMALADETRHTIGNVMVNAGQNPDQMARIVAKSFYRELAKAGFSSAQIVNAATEIISQLSKNLQRHSKRSKNAAESDGNPTFPPPATPSHD